MAAKLVKAIVAARKTILFEGKYVGPGAEVSLPAGEVAELQDLGFLVNPESPAPAPAGEGPTFEPVAASAAIIAES